MPNSTPVRFSHRVLTMMLANRNHGSIGKFLDKLNEHVAQKDITEQQKEQILDYLQDFFVEEHQAFEKFSNCVAKVVGQKIDLSANKISSNE